MTTRVSTRPSGIVRRSAALAVAAAALAGLAPGAAVAANKPATFYFQLGEVEAGPEVDAATRAFALEAVKADLAARPEWASDIAATSTEALVAELQKRKLRGFSVTVRFESFKKDVKEPAPGARRKRVAVNARLSVFGTTIPEAKLAFGGEGEAGTEAEVPDKALEVEGAALAKEVIKDAVKQAVDQAVLKLSLGKAAPLNERKRKKKS